MGRNVPDYNTVDLISESHRQNPFKYCKAPPGLQQFAQNFKETNKFEIYVTNRDVIKVMDSHGKSSTPKPIDEDESGFQEVSSFDQSFYETWIRIMTNNNIRDADEKTLR